ncbi:cysteine desulfurase [Candidatus Pacearchaeota archaeon]|nr:cysteine desulfurase [Candidatus Pacearchaeota archaeon]
MKKTIIYFDNGATTPIYKEVVNEIEYYSIKEYGNPSSPHWLGEYAQEAINNARKELAAEIGAKAQEIVFVSGGTEANNLGLRGIAPLKKGKNKILISAIEHSSIYEVAQYIKSLNYDVREIPVNRYGIIDLNYLEKNIDENTLIVSVMHVNNEIGVIQNIKEIGALCKKKGAIFHTDAVQSFGKERINVRDSGIDLLSASAHKIGGPKGIGFLYVKDGIELKPLIIGGGQEAGRRGGTENVPGIMGFAKALEITNKVNKDKIKSLRDYLMSKFEKIGGKINGSKEERIYNNVNVSFQGIDAENLVLFLSQKGVMSSTRSACLSKQQKENRVLLALGLNKDEIKGSLRFVLNEFITKKDIDFVVLKIWEFLKINELKK